MSNTHFLEGEREKKKSMGKENQKRANARTEKQYHLCVLRSMPEFSQSRRFYKQAFIVVQDRYHFREIRATATGRGEAGHNRSLRK